MDLFCLLDWMPGSYNTERCPLRRKLLTFSFDINFTMKHNQKDKCQELVISLHRSLSYHDQDTQFRQLPKLSEELFIGVHGKAYNYYISVITTDAYSYPPWPVIHNRSSFCLGWSDWFCSESAWSASYLRLSVLCLRCLHTQFLSAARPE